MSGMTCPANEKVYFTSSSQYDPLNPSFRHTPCNSLALCPTGLEYILGAHRILRVWREGNG